MDEKLQKALDFSNYRINLINLKENLRIKFDTMRTIGFAGGIFKIDQTLICFVKTMKDLGQDQIVLIDSNDNPIEIGDVGAFFTEIIGKYSAATNFYHVEYAKLKKSRTTEAQFKDFMETL